MYLTYRDVGKLQGSFITNIDLFLLTEIETETEHVRVFWCYVCVHMDWGKYSDKIWSTKSETAVTFIFCIFLNEYKYFYHIHYQHSSVC